MTQPAPCPRCNDMGIVPLPGRDGFRVCPVCKGETFARRIQGWRRNPVPDPERDRGHI
jgi:hypothetical protein